MTKEDILTVSQVADILRVSKNTIQRKNWRKQNGIPLRKIGKRLLADKQELDKWYKSHNG